MKVEELNLADLHEIFRKIYARERRHGHFLTTFAEAYIGASADNKAVLDQAARTFVEKFKLIEYRHQPTRANAMGETEYDEASQ